MSHVRRFDHVGITVAGLHKATAGEDLCSPAGFVLRPKSFIHSGELSSRSQERREERGMQGLFIEVLLHARVTLARHLVRPYPRGAGRPAAKSINMLEA
jgi:hypothetical protein